MSLSIFPRFAINEDEVLYALPIEVEGKVYIQVRFKNGQELSLDNELTKGTYWGDMMTPRTDPRSNQATTEPSASLKQSRDCALSSGSASRSHEEASK